VPKSYHSRHLLEQCSSRWRSRDNRTLPPAGKPDGFDVFLCHNAADKPVVRWTARRLQERGIRPWLDENELPPGQPWQEELERQIGSIRAAAVFVGPNGIGPWQNQEIRAFLGEFIARRCPVIPVLLPGAEIPAALPLFLRGMTWVDLRKKAPAEIERLIWGITGRKFRTTCGQRR
jgi:hypothetical protein